MKRFIVLFLLCTISFLSDAQLNKAKLDSLFTSLEKNQKAMLSMCISEKGQMIYHKGIGFTDIKKNQRPTLYSLYHIGSISKMFTAVMIFQMIDEKKLTLETTLDQFYPTLPNSSKITIATMLNHRSGLYNFTKDFLYRSYMTKQMNEAELIKLFERFKPESEPNETTSYSNTNYVLLSLIIEKISSHSYNDELKKRICSKINLQHTMVGGKLGSDNYNNVYSYEFEDSNWVEATETDMSIPRGAGAIISTPEDLCTFIESLFAGKLMSDSSFNIMTTLEGKMGHGIAQFPFGNKKAFGHTGSIDGFSSMLGYFPEEKIAYCILGNAWNYSLNDVALGTLSIYFNKPYIVPMFEIKQAADSKSILGNYVNEKMGVHFIIDKEGEQFTAKASGQSAFPLTKISETEFKFEPADITIQFKKLENGTITSFDITQKGMTVNFTRE